MWGDVMLVRYLHIMLNQKTLPRRGRDVFFGRLDNSVAISLIEPVCSARIFVGMCQEENPSIFNTERIKTVFSYVVKGEDVLLDSRKINFELGLIK